MQREDIILSAAQIFREKGFHATSMQDIADSLHLRKGSLYHHISSKQEILLAILDLALDVLIDDLEPIASTPSPAEERLRAMMQRYIERVTESADLAAVLLLEHRSLNPELRSRHIDKRDQFESLWRSVYRDGVTQGEFRNLDDAVVVFGLLGVQNWLTVEDEYERPGSQRLYISDRSTDLPNPIAGVSGNGGLLASSHLRRPSGAGGRWLRIW